MNFTKNILVGVLFLYINSLIAQTTTTFFKSNIQLRVVNKFWSFKSGTSAVGGFYFTKNQLSVYIKQNEIGVDNYYFTSSSCDQVNAIFENSKIGTTSTGNYIKTANYCFVIEISSDFTKIRIKKSNDNDTKWQTLYLLNKPIYVN